MLLINILAFGGFGKKGPATKEARQEGRGGVQKPGGRRHQIRQFWKLMCHWGKERNKMWKGRLFSCEKLPIQGNDWHL